MSDRQEYEMVSSLAQHDRAHSDGAALISIRNVTKTYADGAVHAVDRATIEIQEGEFVCVVGPSGCGKSTLLRMLAGLDDYDDGDILLGGQAVTGPSREVG